ncbi:MAG: cation:proton antiporter [Candidatus Methanomethylophilaceae archaeon]|nr:cation:proton antiporter [Candidatus Methanomethylophilaceae archaeon]
MEFTQVLLMLVVVFSCAKAASFVFNRIGIPGLVGEILVGVVLASVSIGGATFAESLGLYEMVGGERVETDYYHILEVFSELGVMFLLFSVGLETRVKDLMSVGKAAFLVALLGVLIPFVFGYMYVEFFQDGNMYHALFLGAAMVATSVGITARVIKDMRLTDAKESRIIIGAAVIDDILGMIVLAIVSGMAKSGEIDIVNIAVVTVSAFAFVIIIMLFSYFAVPWLKAKVQEHNDRKFEQDKNYIPTKYNMLISGIVLCFAFAWLAETIGLAAIIGAFLAGMIFADYSTIWGLDEKVEAINTLLVSFFFVNVGLKVNLDGIDAALILTVVVVIVLAVLGKYVGCSLGAKIGDKTLEKSSLNIIGIGMVPRGEVGIIVASIGLKIVVDGGTAISQELYTVVVLMSVITTIIAPPLLSSAYRKKYTTDYVVQPDDQI